ncbi:MAG: SMP-30/gluconolactonase/LRE family protein, partial [Geminicoccaceae bacterium]|nr:SMP-30/gluconolactonase/LRE family protein [Geminicoccaceae bacterium]MDW8125665.1 SMP-30/gluconolactonase/LRE family protein [Geminicoccaceae bacterium]
MACDGTVFFSDITWSHGPRGARGGFRAGNIFRFDPGTGRLSLFRSPSGMANGLAFDRDCALLAAEGADRGGRRITRTDLATGRAEILADAFAGRPLNSPNDLAVDRRGRIWFTDPRYVGHEPVEQDAQAVYRLDPDGKLARVLVPEGRPNGIAVSPDGAFLYVAISEPGAFRLFRSVPRRMAIERWSIGADGALRDRRVLVDFGADDGPDGLATDREGNVWAAVQRRDRSGIFAFDPEGRERAFVPLPAPSNLAFGRPPDDDLLWITADRGLWRLRVGKRGWHPRAAA